MRFYAVIEEVFNGFCQTPSILSLIIFELFNKYKIPTGPFYVYASKTKQRALQELSAYLVA